MSEHTATVTVGEWTATLAIKCSYDKTDTTRPCWPYSEEGTPDPAPQDVCTWEQWADEAGFQVCDDWTVEGVPVSCEWAGWDAPRFTLAGVSVQEES